MHRTSLLTIGLSLVLCATTAHGLVADTYPRQPGVDALHYVFRLTLTDLNNEIAGESTVTLRFLAAGIKAVALDLLKASGDQGLTVSAVTCGGTAAPFTHEADRVRITLPQPPAAGGELSCTTTYRGVPRGGLRIINNIHGERTAFSENWPDNARHWLPMIDHPYDKATGELIVTAPAQYQVVANGLLVEETDLAGGARRTHWKQSVPIASWLYAIGMDSDGRDAFVRGLRSSRDRILQLEKKTPDTPIIHRNLSDMRRVLNQFVYQKGGWTLHMLRYTMGTEGPTDSHDLIRRDRRSVGERAALQWCRPSFAPQANPLHRTGDPMPDTRGLRSVLDAAEQAAAADDYASAERLLREAASLQEASLGPLHPDLANTLNNLGVVCEITDKPADAERCFRRAYEIATAVLEPDHPFVATSRKNLEDFCAARGKTVDASTPPPAVEVQVDARQTAFVDIAPQRSTSEEPRPAVARTSSRPLTLGALLAAGLLVTLLATAQWFRANDASESSPATPGASPAGSPATTAEPKPIEPKPIDAPRKITPSRTGPAAESRTPAAPVPKSPPVVADAQLCRDRPTGGARGASGDWRCDPPSRPVAPGRLLFYTRLKSPTDTTVQHRWYRGNRLHQAKELTIRANTVSGYRTYSRTTVEGSGAWRVELRTRDGVLLHQERFIVR